MSELGTIIDQIASGALDVKKAAPKVQKILGKTTATAPAPEPGDQWADNIQTRMVEDDNDYDNTFSEVTAAWIGGKLSDGQYHTLREAVLPNGGKGDRSDTTDGDGDPASSEKPKEGEEGGTVADA